MTTTPNAGGWPRSRLLLLVATVAVTAVALVAGLGLAVWFAFAPTPTVASGPAPVTDAAVRGEVYRDYLAAEPMLQVAAGAASTPSVAAELGPTMTLPAATSVGAVGVASGFPQTPEGAVAQLAAVEVTVVEAMSIPVAHQVHAAWSLPGGVTASEWAMTRNVQSFLTNAGGLGNTKDDSVFVSASPAAGQIKGVDGPDWVLACVLLDVQATIVTDARIGYGHCERMQWTDGRWMIAPGTPPAPAPSVWPGSELALQAGWRTLTDG